MVAHRRHHLAASRRRVEDEGEEEAGLEGAEADNESMSEGSGLSDDEEEEDGDGSEVSEGPAVATNVEPSFKTESKASHEEEISTDKAKNGGMNGESKGQNAASADTQAMRNGVSSVLRGDDANGDASRDEAEAVSFEDMAETPTEPRAPTEEQSNSAATQDTPLDRRRREHDDYKKKRDADPAFVPNRGAFFMHDHRHAGPAANGFRPFGRGRGRGQVGGPYAPANSRPQAIEATDNQWAHDMHDAVASSQDPSINQRPTEDFPQKPAAPQLSGSAQSFSKSIHIANVQVRVLLAGMPEPIIFSAVPVKQHTRLPHHRPPLRRDKPVRISLPDHAPRYIFPAVDRSFIFIPRAMRPNQQGSGRGRGRSSYGHGGYSSRRTSAYGGSMYSPSVAMSRRSSLAHEISRDSIISPTGSTMSRTGLPIEAGKPVVRLPPSTLHHHHPGAFPYIHGPVPVNGPPHAYPPPEDPAHREKRVPLPMHQPRPQKAVSVADIESPATMPFHPPQQQQQQPFHHQVPTQVNGHQYPQDANFAPHTRTTSYPSQASTGTPLSHIPERAIHAQPFQPPQYHGYYPQVYAHIPPQGYYYPQPANAPSQPYPAMVPSVAAAPAFIPGQAPAPYVVSGEPATAAPGSESQPAAAANQTATIAQESNGMVYYYDSSQIYNPPTTYPATSGYPVAQPGGVVGMGGMMTPSPDGYYYPQPQSQPQGPVYY